MEIIGLSLLIVLGICLIPVLEWLFHQIKYRVNLIDRVDYQDLIILILSTTLVLILFEIIKTYFV